MDLSGLRHTILYEHLDDGTFLPVGYRAHKVSDVVLLVLNVVLLHAAAAVDTELPPVMILEARARVPAHQTRGAQANLVTQHVSRPGYLNLAQNRVWLNYAV